MTLKDEQMPAAPGFPVDRSVRQAPRNGGLLDTLERAALLLEGEAAALKECHTLRGKWTRDEMSAVAKAAFDDMAATAKALRAAHKYMQANPLGGPAKVFDACADSIRAGDPIEQAMANFGLAWAA